MVDKNLYINDIVHRNPGFTLVESTVGSLLTVTLKNASAVEVDASRKLLLIDAYRAIRSNLLTREEPVFISTTTQRDALTSIDQGTQIYNITTARDEVYTGTTWTSAAGAGVMSPVAFGDIFEDSETGTVMNSTTKTWVGATLRKVDSNGIVTFADNSTGDRLVIGTGGAGDYEIEMKCDQTNAGGNVSKMTLQVNGVDTTISDEHASDSGDHRQLSAHGILTLADNDFLVMHVVSSTASDVVTGFHVSLTIKRLS